jgi:hypothetical protein
MSAVARDFDLALRILAALAAVLFVVGNRAPASRMGAFLVFGLCH